MAFDDHANYQILVHNGMNEQKILNQKDLKAWRRFHQFGLRYFIDMLLICPTNFNLTFSHYPNAISLIFHASSIYLTVFK